MGYNNPDEGAGKAFCKSKLGLFWQTGWLGLVILTPTTRVCKCTRAKVHVQAKAVASSPVSNRPACGFTGKMENKTQWGEGGGAAASMWFELK